VGQSREEIERALEWAKNNNDESAVRGLTNMLENQNSALNALGPTKERAAALESSQQGVLQQQQGPLWGEKTQGAFDKVGAAVEDSKSRHRQKAQKQYEADLALMGDPANVPGEEEVSEWLLWQGKAFAKEAAEQNKQILRDPESGRLRFAAMPPEQLYDQEKKSSPGKAIAGAITGQTVNLIGERIQNIEETERSVEEMQRFVFTSLPDAEKTRVRNDIARKYEVDPSEITDDVIANNIPPYMLNDIIDENDDNQSIY